MEAVLTMTTLNKRIVEILKEYSCWTSTKYYGCIPELANRIIKTVHENPSIKKGLELLKEKRVKDKWDRKVRKQIKKIKK